MKRNMPSFPPPIIYINKSTVQLIQTIFIFSFVAVLPVEPYQGCGTTIIFHHSCCSCLAQVTIIRPPDRILMAVSKYNIFFKLGIGKIEMCCQFLNWIGQMKKNMGPPPLLICESRYNILETFTCHGSEALKFLIRLRKGWFRVSELLPLEYCRRKDEFFLQILRVYELTWIFGFEG